MPMNIFDKKKAGTLIARSLRGREVLQPKRMEEGAESDNEVAMRSAVEEMMIGMKQNEPRMFMSALKSFLEMHEMEKGEESEEES